ncbi:DUF58 domain-containing protein [Aestuariimicrobium ganziense]|uniref:DUF58 domain-containing protein n=1 Tax=Aestuariimicrobium ganziense TaxID=2773677 RepID=UPI001F28E3D5|nr:DUF58 domain-containing protein [Aestuariimicrobium ganziense]
MLKPWQLLTARGWTFLVAGVVGTIAAMSFGQRDLVWLFALLVLLPVAAVVVVGRSRMQLACERRLEPGRTAIGERLIAHLDLTKRDQWPLGLLRFEETVPRELGRRPRFTVHQFTGEWTRRVSYPLVGLARGRYTVGPLLVRAQDPFGLAHIDRRFRSVREVMITPRVVPLSSMSTAPGSGQSGESTPQKIGLVGQDDVLVREYRAGDDVRRIHWRSTARRDEIMVRREEQAWDPAATLFLDNRPASHAGQGRENSFEWAVSALASIGMHMIRSGFRTTVVDCEGQLLEASSQDPAAAREALLVAMTDEDFSQTTDLKVATEACGQYKAGDMMVAVMGRLTQADVQALVTMRARRSQGLALVLDVDTFTARRFRGTPEQADEHQASIDLLRRHAWRVVDVKHSMGVDEAWRSLDRMGASL